MMNRKPKQEISDMINWYKDEIQIAKLQGNKKGVEELKKELKELK